MSGDSFSTSGLTNDPSNPNPNQQQQQQPAPAKKKRNLPGNPDPDAEVIALSPRSLMATNRFLCEICNKGFQRDQNLQLHRRGHNLPWKLRQRTGEVRKRVYVCPEKTCVHHDPSRALGDLTGVKKHFSRKHGEKKWKCEKCSKKYAVQSDWKAHSKTCGTREYRCDCGTLFSRRDSFVTHRAFCDALTEESARLSSVVAAAAATAAGFKTNGLNQNNNQHLSFGQDHMIPENFPHFQPLFRPNYAPEEGGHRQDGVMIDRQKLTNMSLWLDQQAASNSHLNPSANFPSNAISLLSSNSPELPKLLQMASANAAAFGSTLDYCGGCPLPVMIREKNPASPNPTPYSANQEKDEIEKGHLIESLPPPFYSRNQNCHQTDIGHMSATALLQKAAQMGATTSNASPYYSSVFEGLMSSSKSMLPHGQSRNNDFHLFSQGKPSAESLQDLMMNTSSGEILSDRVNLSSNGNMGSLLMNHTPGIEQQQPGPSKVTPWSVEVGNSLTRDFLGVGRYETGRPFLQQELMKMASMSSGFDLMTSSYGGRN